MKLFIIFLLFSQQALSSIDDLQWNKGNSKLSPQKIEKLNKLLFNDASPFFTKSFLIIKNGEVIYENNREGFSTKTPQRLWSISKSIVSTLIGVAHKQGLIHKSEKVSKFIEGVDKRITINHLLQMSSGINWSETYEKFPYNSDVLTMLFGKGRYNMAEYTLLKKQGFPPGERFNYSSGETNLLMYILKKKISRIDYETFPWNELFNKLEIQSATWERDKSGNFVGSSYLYLSPRDLSKIGLLYLNDGTWKGQSIITPEWVKYSSTLAKSIEKNGLPEEIKHDSYGAHWWLNTKLKKFGKKHKHAPRNTFMALGHHGQALIIVPEEKTIIVRTANDKKANFDRNEIFKVLYENKYTGL